MLMEITHNFCISTRVRKVGAFSFKKNPKSDASNYTTLYPKKAMEATQNVSTQVKKHSLVRKDFPTPSLCFPTPSFKLAELSLEQHGSEPRNKDGTAEALFTLFNVEGKGEAVIAPDTPNATLFFM